MIKKKPLPRDIQFSFSQLQDPVCIEILLTLNVFLGKRSSFGNDPVPYAVNLTFFKDDAEGKYIYQNLELDACYHIDPYDTKQLEGMLKKRLHEILEHCALDVNSPMKDQLEAFLAEYGGYEQARFML